MVVELGIHYVGDAIDTQLQWSPEDIDGTITTFPKLIAYFFDEVLGHKILYASMMLILVCLYIFQYWHPLDLEKKETNYLNTTLLFIYGLIYGIALAFSFMEGQSAFEYLFICLILLVSTLIQVLRIKEKFTIKIKKYPYSIFFIAINAGVILVLLLYVPQIGNSYPFFPQ